MMTYYEQRLWQIEEELAEALRDCITPPERWFHEASNSKQGGRLIDLLKAKAQINARVKTTARSGTSDQFRAALDERHRIDEMFDTEVAQQARVMSLRIDRERILELLKVSSRERSASPAPVADAS